MRLLLDEQLSAVIAVTLRNKDHDVVAVTEPALAYLRAPSDWDLFVEAQTLNRAIVTENVAHFRACADRWAAAGAEHHGLIYTTNTALPRHRHDLFVAAAVKRLDALLRAHPESDARSLELFLTG